MKIDPALTEQGDWVENIPDLPGIRIKARGTNNSDYRALEAKLVREIPRAERIEGVSPKEQDRIAGQLLLQTVVLNVEGGRRQQAAGLHARTGREAAARSRVPGVPG